MGVFHVFKIVQTVPNGATHHKPKGPKFSLKKPTLHIICLYEIKLVLNNRQLNRNKIPFNFWRSNTLWYQKTIYMHKNTTSPCQNKLKRLVYCLGIFHSGTSFEISVHFGTQSIPPLAQCLWKKIPHPFFSGVVLPVWVPKMLLFKGFIWCILHNKAKQKQKKQFRSLVGLIPNTRINVVYPLFNKG